MEKTHTNNLPVAAPRSLPARMLLPVFFAAAFLVAPATAQSQDAQQPPAAQSGQPETPAAPAPDAQAAQQPTAPEAPPPANDEPEDTPAQPEATPVQAEIAPAQAPDAQATQQAAQQPPAPSPAQPASPAPGNTAQPAPSPAQAPDAQAPQQAAQPAPSPAAADNTPLRVAASGGAYGQAQERALFAVFSKREGRPVVPAAYDGTFEALKAHAGDWDVVSMDGATAARGCHDQLLETLDTGALQTAPNGASPAEDFFPGALQPCAVASMAWSAVVIYDVNTKKAPAKVADFFDTRRFPGKRLLPKSPRFTLELALLADGVPPADIYTQLSTPEGQNRAFGKLASLKDRLQWYDAPSEAFEQIGRKDVAMGLAFSGRAFMAIVRERKAVGILWDRQIYAFDYWGIPRGAKNADAAKMFIRFATSPGQLADVARLFPYGPARRSAVALVGKHAEVDIDVKPYLPTHEPNIRNALAFDAAWWDANAAAVQERFTAWLEGRNTPPAR